jgi:hypothetical protein
MHPQLLQKELHSPAGPASGFARCRSNKAMNVDSSSAMAKLIHGEAIGNDVSRQLPTPSCTTPIAESSQTHQSTAFRRTTSTASII